jgi:L-rhamnose isomerase/sugar isomerase
MQNVLHALLLRQIAKIFRSADCATLLPPVQSSQEIRTADLRNNSKRKQTRNSTADTSDSPLMTGDAVFSQLDALEIETPSWGYGNSGTRFHVYPWPGAARTVWERIDDAALVHELTGCCPSVALHIPWDTVDDWSALADYARGRGIRIGAINPNLFGDDSFRLGSLANPDAAVRRRALEHCIECVEIARQLGSTIVSLWLPDGTNYPGQDDLRGRHARLLAGLEELYAALSPDQQLLVEYKFFEPAFYSTDLPDWGTAALVCRRLGPQAQVLVDTGHHPQGTNIEQIVALLVAEGLLGGFHFNNRKYADDDLIAGSVDPFELFRIMHEIALAEVEASTAFMLDQSHNVEGKIGAMLQSVMNIQTAYAKALLIDEAALSSARTEGDVLRAHLALTDAFETDVRPVVAGWRADKGLDPDPVRAFRDGGHAERRARERGIAPVESAYEKR